MAKRKRKFTYALSKVQIQLTIEALLMARSAGAHCQVKIIEESGEEHTFEGITNDGRIDKIVDKLEQDGIGYQIQLNPTGVPYTRSEDKSIEATINCLNDSLGEIEEAESAEMEKVAAAEAPQLIEKLYEMLESEGK